MNHFILFFSKNNNRIKTNIDFRVHERRVCHSLRFEQKYPTVFLMSSHYLMHNHNSPGLCSLTSVEFFHPIFSYEHKEKCQLKYLHLLLYLIRKCGDYDTTPSYHITYLIHPCSSDTFCNVSISYWIGLRCSLHNEALNSEIIIS